MPNIELKQSTRYILLRLVPIAVLLIFVARLFFIQIINHDKYVSEANSMRIKQRELIAKRGEIYMMSGVNKETTPLVINERTWTIFVDPSYVDDKNKVQVELQEILGDQMITSWEKVWSNMKNMYVEVAKNVNYDTVVKIKDANLKGVGRKETSRRVYPAGSLAAQVVGFVNAEGVGSGIEGSLNARLTGKNGMLKTVTDVNSVPLSIGDDNVEIPAQNGEDIVLTLDENIQRKVEKVLKNSVDSSNGAAKSASALVHCAAVADYRPKVAATEKIKDSRSQLILELEPNPNILRDSVAQKLDDQVIVGFALETDHFEEHAAEKLAKSGADALLLNAPVAADSGFGRDCVRFALVEKGKPVPPLAMGEKVDLAETILNFCLERLNG